MEKGLDFRQTQIPLGFSPRRIDSIDPQNVDPTLRDIAQDVVEQVAYILTILKLQRFQFGEIQVHLQSAWLGRERVSGKHQMPDCGPCVGRVTLSDPQTRVGQVRCGGMWELEI